MPQIFALLIFSSLFSFGQDTLNQVEKNGMKQGYWKITEEHHKDFYNLISEGRFYNDKKIDKWVYTIHEVSDSSIKDCQQLSIYTSKEELYEEDGSVTVTLSFPFKKSSLRFDKDTLTVIGDIYSGELVNPAICTCKRKSVKENLSCTLKTKSGYLLDKFDYGHIDFYLDRVLFGVYDRELKSK